LTIDPLEFGQQLLETGDLDPVYLTLYGAYIDGALHYPQLKRICIAYWCYYHLGVAAQVSESVGDLFWWQMEGGVHKFPRGTERRHFRGAAAEEALFKLHARFSPPETLIGFLTSRRITANGVVSAREAISGGRPRVDGPSPSRNAPRGAERLEPLPFATVSERVQVLPLFGPWIAFKVADMLDRVLLVPVDFSDCQLLQFYKEPRQGATLAARRWKLDTPELALDRLLAKLRKANHYAPPAFDRLVNVQEAETVLCKWKSHLNGHYYIGKDIQEVAHGLEAIPSKTGRTLLKILEERTKFKRRNVLITL